MAYELTGKIKIIQDEQTFESGFSKREMVVTVEDGNYPQDINLEFMKDKASLLDGLKPDEEVKVTFDIRGREYNGRYYNNLQGWKVETVNSDGRVKETNPVTENDNGSDLVDLTDIPF